METIVTHNGMFHADDVFAVATMLLLFPKAKVIRSRDPQVWATADVMVDVGGEYYPHHMRFDHHQFGGAGERQNGIPYASFGLVWKEFGEKLAGFEGARYIDKKIVTQIDALDNNVEISVSKFDGVREYNLSDYFHSFVDHGRVGEDYLHEVFMEVVGKAKLLLDRESRNAKEHEKGLERVRHQVAGCDDRRLVILDEELPWKEVLVPIYECLYVVYPRGDGAWVVKSVNKDLDSFDLKKPFPESWAGKIDQDLAKSTGVDDAIFCHNKRFIAVAGSKEGAIELAELALSL